MYWVIMCIITRINCIIFVSSFTPSATSGHSSAHPLDIHPYFVFLLFSTCSFIRSSIHSQLRVTSLIFFAIVHINCSFSVEETVSCLVTGVYNERNKQKFLQAISAVDCNIPNTLNSFNHFHSMSISLRDQWFPKNEIKRNTLIENSGFLMFYEIQ